MKRRPTNRALIVLFHSSRAKWKKRKKTSNVYRNTNPLLPAHTLSPFGSMSSSADSLCTFGSGGESRWPLPGTAMGQIPPHSLSLGHPLGRQPPSSSSFVQSGGNSVPSCSQSAITPAVCGAPYGAATPYHTTTANSINCSPPTPNQAEASPTGTSCSPQTWLTGDTSAWRGSSIFRRKAMEHSVMTIR